MVVFDHEQHGGLLKLHVSIEDTGEGLPADAIQALMHDLHRGRIDIKSEMDGYRKRLAVALQNIELMKGQFWMESPSSISTDPQKPGMKYSFTVEVLPAENIKGQVSIISALKRWLTIETL